jgi:2,4-dienoyl-CoA reductase-like NADH-dependent reductase (Old Yellow Enzyme family)
MTCLFTLSRCRQASPDDLRRLVDDFVRAARLATAQAGFDAVELHLGHGYLLSQFLSPYTNRRQDEYGGELTGRLRFPLEVARAVRAAVSADKAVTAKINLSDGFAQGLGLDEAIQVARALEGAGLDGLVLSGGFVSKTPFYMLRGELPVREMVRNESAFLRRTGLRLFGRLFVPQHDYQDLFFFDQARKVLPAVSIPVSLLGGIRSLAHMHQALEAGFGFVSLGRPLIHLPDLPRRFQSGEMTVSPCEPCNRCVAEMEAGGIRCTHPVLGNRA